MARRRPQRPTIAQAEENTRATITTMLTALGYAEVEVRFDRPSPTHPLAPSPVLSAADAVEAEPTERTELPMPLDRVVRAAAVAGRRGRTLRS